MSRYIDTTQALREINAYRVVVPEDMQEVANILVGAFKEGMCKLISNMPATDVVPVIHGHLVGEADGYADGELVYDVWFCSECDYTFEDDANPNGSKHHAYCPVCGAKMDEVSE